MTDITIRSYTSEDADAIVDLQVRYASAFPGVAVVPAEIYADPGFAGGQNILLAFDRQERLLAYAPLFPRPVEGDETDEPHQFWSALVYDPALSDPTPVLDALYARLLARAREIWKNLPLRHTCQRHACRQHECKRPAQLAAELLPVQVPILDYVRAKGWVHGRTAFQMARDLSAPVPDLSTPAGIEVRQWEMREEAEQRDYLQAKNSAFPEAPWNLEGLQHFLQQVLWPCGPVSASALVAGQVVGSVLIYWDPYANARTGRQSAYTEEIFCVPAWRGRGIASACIATALRLLQERGMEEARLEVRATNENALRIYQRLGYRVTASSLICSLDL